MTSSRSAYTLIEILVVITIIGVLSTLALPSLTGIRGASNIGLAVETVQGALTNARQLAVTKNREIEIRLIEMADPSGPAARNQMRAVQILELRENGSYSAGKVRSLPSGTIIGASETVTSLSSLANVTASGSDSAIPRVSRDYKYRSFRFRPDGTLNLQSLLPSADSYFLTIYDEKAKLGSSSLPPNYATIQLEPDTGAVVLYRP